MTDPGLNHRLRQRSRRAGIMIGLSMLLTIAVCVASFSVIYAGLDDIVGDFVSRAESDTKPTPRPANVAEAATTEPPVADPTEPPVAEPTAAPEATPTPEIEQVEESTDTGAETDEEEDEDTGEFEPDYQIDSTGSVNFRTGPGTQFDTLYALPLEEPLEYLGVSEPTTNPEADGLGSGQVWMQFRTENGDEGWIREIDVTEYVP